jgi:hypothetical protein
MELKIMNHLQCQNCSEKGNCYLCYNKAYIQGNKASSYEVLLECFQAVIVVTVLVKEYERGGQGHTSASLLHQSAK